MFDSSERDQRYPELAKYAAPLARPQRPVIGREVEVHQLLAALSRPELCNALLLADAGAGKSTLVQATMVADSGRDYLEVDLARMIAELANVDEMGDRLKTLFDEAERYRVDEKRELVLFIDEFHQIMQLSQAAVEAMKPILAESGTRGLRIIGATTNDEFNRYVKPDLALTERLQKVRLNAPDRATTIAILRGMAEHYQVGDLLYDDHVLELIYEYTTRYVPESSQPRKSILMLDAMVGWHRHSHRALDEHLLADILLVSYGVNVAFRVDPTRIKARLDARVFSQSMATEVVSRRLQLCVADLQDHSKPMSSFLFTGSTGVGKTQLTKELAQLLFGDAQRHLIRFDMTEYSQDDSVREFRSELSRRVADRPHSVVLFDEVEKAAAPVVRMLLQVLDDGRLSDDNNREVSFLNAYIVLTTNAGAEIYETIANYAIDDTGSGKELRKYMKAIRRSISDTSSANSFPPELLGRIDAIVPFQPLSRATVSQIINDQLRRLAQDLFHKRNIRTKVDPKVVQYLVEDRGDSDSNAGGARYAISRFSDEVVTEVATFINHHPNERAIDIFIQGELASDHKTMVDSEARVCVAATK